jgi:hypothetical protein
VRGKKVYWRHRSFYGSRPLDRPLWYALNQCGGRTAWAEGFAAWAHYVAEEKAGKALHEPHVASVVESLRVALASQGWLADTPRAAASLAEPETVSDLSDGASSASSAGTAGIEPMPDVEMVYAPAEDDQETAPDAYDANTDPILRRELF